MYEVLKYQAKVNDVTLDTYERSIKNGNVDMTVEVGTTGFCGGNRDSGTRVIFKLSDDGGADFHAEVSEATDGSKSVTICLCGDDELIAFLKALDFASTVIAEQVIGIDD